MNRVVWKFPLQVRGWNTLKVGGCSRVVLTAIDPASGAPAVWIEHEVPEGGPNLERDFGVFPTGGTIADNADHVGSMIDRSFVWHIYERRADPEPMRCPECGMGRPGHTGGCSRGPVATLGPRS